MSFFVLNLLFCLIAIMRLATVNSFPISSNNHWWRGNDSNDNLPNCCDKKDAWQTYAICKRTPANQFRFVGPMNFTIENRPTSIDFHKAIDGRIIVIIGDSTMRQWMESLMCYLSVGWSGWKHPKDISSDDKNFLETIGKVPVFASGQVGFFRQAVSNGYIIFYTSSSLTSENIFNIVRFHSSNSSLAYRIVVDMKAVHYQYHEREAFRHEINKIVDFCNSVQAPCVFRESLPQHFLRIITSNISTTDTTTTTTDITKFDDGLFNNSQSSLGCVNSIVAAYDSLATWRNVEIW